MNTPIKYKTVCFGEVLWDVLPTSKQVGGAPLNVAFHLQSLGCESNIISKVGDDELGRELLNYMESRTMNTAFVQRGISHLTGVAKANISDKNEVTYKILQPVAWDYIETTEANKNLTTNANAFIYGSLAARSSLTLDSLKTLLNLASFTVFDVNLRPPFYSPELIEELLSSANLIKLNETELAILGKWIGAPGNERACLKAIYDKYQPQAICTTKGGEGAILLFEDNFYEHKGYPVVVKDTIGSGDAFLAGLIYNFLNGSSPQDSLAFACAMGSMVATHEGGTPKLSKEAIESFIFKSK